MNRSELISKLSEKNPQFLLQDVDFAVKSIFDAMSNTLAKGGRIEIRGFGIFNSNYRSPRKGRNPSNGKSVFVPAKYVLHFKMGKKLRERVDI